MANDFTAEMIFNYDTSSLKANLMGLDNKLKAALLMFAKTKATVLEAHMKTHRVWTDRTNMAKTMLSASVSQPSTDTIRITLSQGVDYGIWLELAHDKNYAIIEPTINSEGPKIFNELNGMLNKMGV